MATLNWLEWKGKRTISFIFLPLKEEGDVSVSGLESLIGNFKYPVLLPDHTGLCNTDGNL